MRKGDAEMKKYQREVIGWFGVGLIIAGFYLAYPPLGFIAAGITVVLALPWD